jgi:hypothetical protein
MGREYIKKMAVVFRCREELSCSETEKLRSFFKSKKWLNTTEAIAYRQH